MDMTDDNKEFTHWCEAVKAASYATRLLCIIGHDEKTKRRRRDICALHVSRDVQCAGEDKERRLCGCAF